MKPLLLSIFLLITMSLCVSFTSASLYVVASNTTIYTSTNGTSWTALNYNGTSITALKLANNGRYIYIIDNNVFKYSIDDGVTFFSSGTSNLNSTTELCTSSDGVFVFIGRNDASHNYYRSTNYGQSFTTVAVTTLTDQAPHVIACSQDGKYVLAGSQTGGSGLYQSGTYGNSFTRLNYLGGGNYQSLFVSADGTYQYAGTLSGTLAGTLFASTNSGVSFTSRIPSAGVTVTSIASINGTAIASSSGSTDFYNTTNAFVNYSVNNSIGFSDIAVDDTSNTWIAYLGSAFYVSTANGTHWNNTHTFNQTIRALDISLGTYTPTNGSINPVCYDNQYLCTNPLFYGDSLICNIDNRIYCAEGCVNTIFDNSTSEIFVSTYAECNQTFQDKTEISLLCGESGYLGFLNFIDPTLNCISVESEYTVTRNQCTDTSANEFIANRNLNDLTISGSCVNPSYCQNECNTLGLTECDGINAIKTCSQYTADTDPCLEWSYGNYCSVGNVCAQGSCQPASGVGLSSNSAFTVTPWSASSDTTAYTLDTINKKLTVDTKNFLHVQQFSTNTNSEISYTSRTCNYVESLVTSNTGGIVSNGTTDFNFNTVGTTSRLEFNILPTNLVNTTVTIVDSVGNNVTSFVLFRNTTEKTVYVYRNNTLLYTSVAVGSSDTLTSITMKFIFDFPTSTYTTTFIFNRYDPDTIDTFPASFNTLDYQKLQVTGDNATIGTVNVYTFTQPVGMSSTLKGDYSFLPCSYTTQGCRVVRTYNNNGGTPDFTNYYDYTICMSTLSATSVSNVNAGNSLPEISAGTKIFIILSVILITLIGFSVGGYAVGNGVLGMVVGSAVSMLVLIVSAIPDAPFIGGFTPPWVVVMIAIFIVLVASFLAVRFTNSGGGSNVG